MAYKAKDTRRSAAKASARRRDVEDKVNQSIGALERFDSRMKDIAKIQKLGSNIQDASLLYGYFKKQDKADRADYKAYKSSFDEILMKKTEEDPSITSFFPSYKDYKKGDFSPTIGDTVYNRTSLDYSKSGIGSDILDIIMKGSK